MSSLWGHNRNQYLVIILAIDEEAAGVMIINHCHTHARTSTENSPTSKETNELEHIRARELHKEADENEQNRERKRIANETRRVETVSENRSRLYDCRCSFLSFFPLLPSSFSLSALSTDFALLQISSQWEVSYDVDGKKKFYTIITNTQKKKTTNEEDQHRHRWRR